MVIPREGKYVRLYIQVTEVDENGKAVRDSRSTRVFSLTTIN